MLVDPQFRKCVAYICEGVGRRDPIGTAFFVAVHVIAGIWATYAVTARHVVEGNQHRELHLRVPTKAGGFEDLAVPFKRWKIHETTDLAAIAVDVPDEKFDTTWLPVEMCLTKLQLSIFERFGFPIGEGDDVFYPGLFAKYPGLVRPLPVMRFGNIALMPYEPIPVEWRVPGKVRKLRMNVRAYLVEVRSWHGFSGSPTFLYFPHEDVAKTMVREAPTQTTLPDGLVEYELPATGGGMIGFGPRGPEYVSRRALISPHLLGVVSSFWDYEIDARRRYGSHAGLAVVIPADDIVTLLKKEAFMKARKRMAEKEDRRRPAARPASRETEDRSTTREEFTEALKRASRRLPPSGSARGTKGT